MNLVHRKTIHPSIVLSSAEGTVAVEGSLTLTATTVPANATVTWTSSDDDVALVEGGVVSGVAVGTATITATITVGGTNYSANCAITVTGE